MVLIALSLPTLSAWAAVPEDADGLPVPTPTPWIEQARLTYYGAGYLAGWLTASGEPYDPAGNGCAVGPVLLNRLRTKYADAAGTYTIKPCWDCVGLRWGWTLRLVADDGRVVVCRVDDTGLDGLDVDLPTDTFASHWPLEKGVVLVSVQVIDPP